jgi:hypothetical protein
VLLSILLLFASSLPMNAQEATYVLDVSAQSSLKAIFDAGLRPTNVRGMERLRCEVRDTRLAFIGQQGIRVQMDAEYAEFRIGADEALTQAYAETRNMALDEAMPEASRLLAMVGDMPRDFQTRMKKAKETRDYEPLRGLGVSTPRGIEPSFGIGFVPGDFVPEAPQELHVRIGIRIYWRNGALTRKLRTEPIKAPRGYEQFSMLPVITPTEKRRLQSLAAIAAQTPTAPSSITFPSADGRNFVVASDSRGPEPATPGAESFSNRTKGLLWIVAMAFLVGLTAFAWQQRS